MPQYDHCVMDPNTFPIWQAPDHSRKVSPLIGPDSCGANDMATGLWWLAPGHQSEPDIHPDAPEVYFVVAGEGILELEEERYPVKQGMTVYIPAGVKHQTFNTGTQELCYYFFFSPIPSGPAREQKQQWTQLPDGNR